MDMSATFANLPTPALFTRTSTPPKRATVSSIDPLRLGRIPDIGHDRVQVRAGPEPPGRSRQILLVPAGDRHLHAAIEERARDRQPDTLRSAGDNSNHAASA